MRLCKWEDLPEFMQTEAVRPYYEHLRKKWFNLILKRTFDFAASSIMLILLSPVLLVLAVWIKIDSKGPVFYRQERVTQYGKIFRIYKFRTMVQDADKIGSLVTVGGDSRITKAGGKLRGCRLDELPQLINIWKGEMTFVGTRPEVAKYVKQYTDEMYATLLLPAGVTSEASIKFKNEAELISELVANGKDANQAYVEVALPKKMVWNLEMTDHFNLLNEFLIMLKTVWEVMK